MMDESVGRRLDVLKKELQRLDQDVERLQIEANYQIGLLRGKQAAIREEMSYWTGLGQENGAESTVGPPEGGIGTENGQVSPPGPPEGGTEEGEIEAA